MKYTSNSLIIWRSLVQAQAGPQIGFKRTEETYSLANWRLIFWLSQFQEDGRNV